MQRFLLIILLTLMADGMEKDLQNYFVLEDNSTVIYNCVMPIPNVFFLIKTTILCLHLIYQKKKEYLMHCRHLGILHKTILQLNY
ncbi:MAG: hypothetical protein ACI9OE_001801 [Mariniflexile sp.]|jgi:hypothetical protein